MAFDSWVVGRLPVDPAGFPRADWPQFVGDIPTLGRTIMLAMPCVGLDVGSTAMRETGWRGGKV
eukprot:5821728-Lingulodinium_polyedra.AAC.1